MRRPFFIVFFIELFGAACIVVNSGESYPLPPAEATDHGSGRVQKSKFHSYSKQNADHHPSCRGRCYRHIHDQVSRNPDLGNNHLPGVLCPALHLCGKAQEHPEKAIMMKMTHHIIQLESVDSTNTYIRNTSRAVGHASSAPSWRGSRPAAGAASAGPGIPDPGLDLTFSAVFIPAGTRSRPGLRYPACGLAVYRALRPLLDDDLHLKWPNDIRYGDRKLGGILCEAVFQERQADRHNRHRH